ncbi:MAG TPA: MBL fold metallo-hydrolase [Solirubrobacteraceae bacterium]|jgi:L-ascorbate metabolism protein UlaG (beta-lactamase superfamily)|nr:MBL fold metallo-hydrolase [Solirubrobacteraceae bacterium]
MLQDGGPSADRIVFVGHSTVLIELDGARLLTDPVLRARVAHLRRGTEPVEVEPPAIDAVLISHLHHDHLDTPSLRLLGTGTRMVLPAGAGAWLRRRRFEAVTELGTGDATGVGALTVTAVAARHDGRRHPGGRRAAALGYLVRGSRSIYFAGDTELFGEMEQLAGGLDVALVPVAGWGSKLGPGHMDPLDAARAVRLLRPRVAIPIHWGTLFPRVGGRRLRERAEEPPRLFAEHVARLAPGTEVRILSPGQQTTL